MRRLLSAAGRRLLRGRNRTAPVPVPATRSVVVDQIAAAVAERERLDRHRALAMAGLVRAAALLGEQRDALTRTRLRVEQAVARAEQVGSEHAADGDDTSLFESTAAALRRELDVVDVLQRQLDELGSAARLDAAAVQAVWQSSSDRLNALLGAEVTLLVRLERDARTAAIDRARDRPGQ